MTKNVGGIDKVLRIVAGIALLAFALTGVPPQLQLARLDRHRAAGDRVHGLLPRLRDPRGLNTFPLSERKS